jgi:hypothetical protein
VTPRVSLLLACLLLGSGGATFAEESAESRFSAGNALSRAGDHPRAIATWASLATDGHESASLYWNWAQAASARGARGEALWALLRARDIDPADGAVHRDIERVREALGLDAAEVAPDPRPFLVRWGRRLRLDLLAVVLATLSLVARATASFVRGRRLAIITSWSSGVLAVFLVGGLVAVSMAPAHAVVVHRGAPLLDSASPSADLVGSLREGEVVPVLDSSGEWIRVEDSSGARGWVHQDDARRIDRPAVLPSP